jgi:hypothetical protein
MERIIFPFQKGEISIFGRYASHNFLRPAALNHKISRNGARWGAFSKIFFRRFCEEWRCRNRKENDSGLRLILNVFFRLTLAGFAKT